MFQTIAAVLLCASVLAACASQIMKSYIGKPLSEAVMDYGPPVTAFDVDDQKRAFIWSMTNSYSLPGTSTTTGNLNMIGNMGIYSATTITSPPQTFTQRCNYTVFAERIPGAPTGPAAWRIVDFRKPNLMCE